MAKRETGDAVKPHGVVKKSAEQLSVGASVRAGRNVMVDAVAGSGKTTTALYLAEIMLPKRTLILLYNKRLSTETRKKVPEHMRAAVLACTIHSLAFNTYGYACNPPRRDAEFVASDADTDAGARSKSTMPVLNNELLVHILEHNTPPKPLSATVKYGLLIVDEAQDVTPLYHAFLRKIMAELLLPDAQVAVLGDRKQAIYSYAGADVRYLVNADTHFKNDREWDCHMLGTSFRVPVAIAAFVNNTMLKEPRIAAHTCRGLRVKYVAVNLFRPRYVVETIKAWVATYGANDIFVLTASTRKRGPVVKVLNALTNSNVPVYVMDSYLEPRDQDLVMKDKVVFSTFHKSKGLERKCVLILGFDSSYLEYYNRNCNPRVCPNELYVAVTRASVELVLVAGHNKSPLPFLDMDKLGQQADIIVIDPAPKRPRAPASYTGSAAGQMACQDMWVTTITASATPEELTDLRALVSIVEMPVPTGAPIDLPVLDKFKREDVSDINGMAVTMFYEYTLKRSVSFLHVGGAGNDIKMLTEKRQHILHRNIEDFVTSSYHVFDVARFLRFVTTASALSSGLYYRLFQLRKYNWITLRQFGEIYRNMHAVLGDIASPSHVTFEPYFSREMPGCRLNGRLDIMHKDLGLLEIKCVGELEIEHVLQCALYMYLARKESCMLYNVKQNHLQKIALTCDTAQFDAYIEKLVSARLYSGQALS
jgi:hypothetical protein